MDHSWPALTVLVMRNSSAFSAQSHETKLMAPKGAI
jgi:hypothetical protein